MPLPNNHPKTVPVQERSWTRRLAVVIASVCLITLVAACGSNSAETPTSAGGQASTSASTASATTAAATTASTTQSTQAATEVVTPSGGSSSTPVGSPSTDTTTFNLYFLRQDKLGVAHRTIPKTQQVGAAALQDLIKGPNADEQSAGLSSDIPSATQYLGLTITNKVATVNLSGDFATGGDSASQTARLAQVVFTLTQFSTVDQVSFQIDGKAVTSFGSTGITLDHPVARSDYEDVTPAILVESPAVGDTVTSQVRLTGSANTFEAAFTIDVLDADGKLLQEQHATATSGTGTRGTFDVSVPFNVAQQQSGKIVVFELSAKDGSKTNVVEIPVTLAPPK